MDTLETDTSGVSAIDRALPHGTTLHCRVAGAPGRPVLLFLHGFPEGAFIWDEQLAHFARPENGGYHCVAPYLRGFGPSSSPAETEAYRAKHLVQDVVALIDAECTDGAPLACLVAHDWGGAVAWNVANQHPAKLQRLMVLNAPHPGTFLRELQHSPEQQEASRELAPLWQQCAASWQLDCHCCDASFTPGEDGLHWRADYHASLATTLAERLRH